MPRIKIAHTVQYTLCVHYIELVLTFKSMSSSRNGRIHSIFIIINYCIQVNIIVQYCFNSHDVYFFTSIAYQKSFDSVDLLQFVMFLILLQLLADLSSSKCIPKTVLPMTQTGLHPL